MVLTGPQFALVPWCESLDVSGTAVMAHYKHTWHPCPGIMQTANG